jgi:mono/diheme cytochrome c family protein
VSKRAIARELRESEPQPELGPDGEHEYDPRSIPFFPDFALREALAASVFLVLLVIVASFTRAPLEPVADPAASGYVPRPEWYFLFLFQTLRYFPGNLEVLGTFFLPTVALALVISAPFLDRREPRPHPLLPRTRPIRFWPRAVGAVVMGVIATLTIIGALAAAPIPQPESQMTEAQAAGKAIFDKMGCASCHAIASEGGTRGPDLTGFGSRPDAKERVLVHFSVVSRTEGSDMPAYQLSSVELRNLAAYLLGLKKG